MVQTGNWVTPFIAPGVPFWAKPILSFWMTAVSFEAFGFNAFAARLSALLVFLAAGALVYALGRDAAGRLFGIAAACVFASTALAFYLGGAVMTDPALMLGVALVMTSFWKCVGAKSESKAWGILFFVWGGDRTFGQGSDRRHHPGPVDRGLGDAAPQMA